MQKPAKLSISVVFPCYNDSKSIGVLIKDAFSVLKKISYWHEVIVVEDGSEDNSREVLENLIKKYKKLRVFFHKKNMGYGAALRTGFKNAKGDLIFYTDGDGQYDVKELILLIDKLDEKTDFVNGYKIVRHDPLYRIIVGNLYGFLARLFFKLPIRDVDCDFRLIRKNLLSKLDIQTSSGSICISLVKKAQRAGARFKEVPINHYYRRFGHSQFFRPDRILITLKELVVLWIQLMIIDTKSG